MQLLSATATATEVMEHVPVLLQEVIRLLEIKSGGIYVDATLGGGGHARALLEASGPEGRLIGIDRDSEAIKITTSNLETFGERVRVFHASFSEAESVLSRCLDWFLSNGLNQDERPEKELVDGFLFDLGISSFQVDLPERGFSYLKEGPLDMRMDQRVARTARDLVNTSSSEALARILKEYGEERYSKRLAMAILRERRKKWIEGTQELAWIVRRTVPRPGAHKSIARVFQALRIFLNEELEELRKGLSLSYLHLKPGGRIGVISYHSLEDRIVKNYFRSLFEDGKMRLITKKVVRPTPTEMERNRRSRGAKLRVGEKLR